MKPPQSQILFSKHEQRIVPDFHTKCGQNHHILLWDMATNTQTYEKVSLIIQMWHRAKCYFTSMINTWYLITVHNMNKITTFGTVPNSNVHASVAHGTRSWYKIWRKSIQPSWRNVDGWTDGLDQFDIFLHLYVSVMKH